MLQYILLGNIVPIFGECYASLVDMFQLILINVVPFVVNAAYGMHFY